MSDSPQILQLKKRVRHLTIAVWALVLISALQTFDSIIPFLLREFTVGQELSSSVSTSNHTPEAWNGMPLEQKIKRASVIVITENRTHGGQIKAIVKEVRRLKPGVDFHYKIGDEYVGHEHEPFVNTQSNTLQRDAAVVFFGPQGDGAVVFLSGLQPTRKETYHIHDGSIYIAGDSAKSLEKMPVSKFLELVDQSR